MTIESTVFGQEGSNNTDGASNHQQGDTNVPDPLRHPFFNDPESFIRTNIFSFSEFFDSPSPQHHGEEQATSVPPADPKIRRVLSSIRLRPEDTMGETTTDVSTRLHIDSPGTIHPPSCSICLELMPWGGESVTRLPPCGHVFHTSCIQRWLSTSSCMCPTCRYELPTLDPTYESGRIQRMVIRHREHSPRYTREALESMHVRELQLLLPPDYFYNDPSAVSSLSRDTLLSTICVNGWVQVMPIPTVAYRLDTLRAMSIRRLKATMLQAGVVDGWNSTLRGLEKKDLIRIFMDSGRLQIVSRDSGVVVETVVESSDDECFGNKNRHPKDPNVVMEEDASFARDATATVPKDDVGIDTERVGANEDLEDVPDHDMMHDVEDEEYSPASRHGPTTESRTETPPSLSSILDQVKAMSPFERRYLRRNLYNGFSRIPSSQLCDLLQHCQQHLSSREVQTVLEELEPPPAVSLLRAQARNRSIDVSDCLERSDLVMRIQHANWKTLLMDWTSSDLALLADEIACPLNLDLFQFLATHSVNSAYVQTLASVAGLPLSQLAALASVWGVEVFGDDHRFDMVHQLVLRQLERHDLL